jgi:diacylglycerol kinase
MTTPQDDQSLRSAVARKGSFAQTMKAVAWSFLGIRKSAEYEKDVSQLNPVHVILAGVAAAALFVVALVVLVQWVISSGVAGAG